MIERPHIVMNSGPLVQDPTQGVFRQRQPDNAPDWHTYCEAIAFQLMVTGVTGSPTNWSLGAKFQLETPHVSGYQFGSSTFSDLQNEQQVNLIDERAGWYGFNHAPPAAGSFGIIASDADGTPSTNFPIGKVSRTIRPGGRRPSVLFNPVFTGGTNPAVLVTLVVTPVVGGKR